MAPPAGKPKHSAKGKGQAKGHADVDAHISYDELLSEYVTAYNGGAAGADAIPPVASLQQLQTHLKTLSSTAQNKINKYQMVLRSAGSRRGSSVADLPTSADEEDEDEDEEDEEGRHGSKSSKKGAVGGKNTSPTASSPSSSFSYVSVKEEINSDRDSPGKDGAELSGRDDDYDDDENAIEDDDEAEEDDEYAKADDDDDDESRPSASPRKRKAPADSSRPAKRLPSVSSASPRGSTPRSSKSARSGSKTAPVKAEYGSDEQSPPSSPDAPKSRKRSSETAEAGRAYDEDEDEDEDEAESKAGSDDHDDDDDREGSGNSKDTRKKNPASEYVSVQSLPESALSLVSPKDENNEHGPARKQIPSTGTDVLKRKYGVASYPTRDLQDLLPGEIPDEDFSRAKPANQVQFSTFSTYIEPYFRPFVEEDLSFLNERSDNLSPYLIPPLGPNYQDVWAEKDSAMGYGQPANNAAAAQLASTVAKGSSEKLSEDSLATEDISCGPLASRLLSALLKDESDADGTPRKDDDELSRDTSGISSSSAFPEQQGWRVSSVKADYLTLEDRLKREFKYVGILGDDEVNWGAREDDDICAELRALQKRLKVLRSANIARKQRVAKIVHHQMAYQEYAQILEDLDKQVDQAYLKRTRTIKAKKKRSLTATGATNGAAAGGPAAAANKGVELGEGIRALLDKRRRWIDNIGPVFPLPEIIKRVPTDTIFKDISPEAGDDLAA
ncbi:histone acetyltransferases subunit 3-domain-containing protein [Dipodascopsis tothii]|uniref:histone acetyltransferases subunit 3-domain-containing protein n=1 Tax=Dipodascopsis tothii TaxID=44089 RepID=UPI0034CDE84D